MQLGEIVRATMDEEYDVIVLGTGLKVSESGFWTTERVTPPRTSNENADRKITWT